MSPTDRLYADIRNEQRAARRRWLYANDPIWRLTKLKDTWERRERLRRGFGSECELTNKSSMVSA